MKKIVLFLVMCLLLVGCGKTKIQKYKGIMSENDYVIIDVRTKEEYDDGHLVDAINIPYDEIDETIDINKEKIIFVYCKSGNRSKYAYEVLKNLGYTTYDLGAFQDIDLPKA